MKSGFRHLRLREWSASIQNEELSKRNLDKLNDMSACTFNFMAVPEIMKWQLK